MKLIGLHMLNLFKIVHIYIEKDYIFWILFTNGKVRRSGIYSRTLRLVDLKSYFLKEFSTTSLRFFNFKINASTIFYKISILPCVENFLSNDNLEIISKSIFNKKYLNFDYNKYQFLVNEQSFRAEIIFIALDKEIYNYFNGLGLMSINYYFEELKLLNISKIKKTCILSFMGNHYCYEFNTSGLIDINFVNDRVVKALSTEIIYIKDKFKIDISFFDSSPVRPKFVSLLCTK